MDNGPIDDPFCLGASISMDTVDFDRMPVRREHLGNLSIPNLLSPYTGQKQLR